MTTEANMAVVERFFHEMLDQHNGAIEPELFTEDCVRHTPDGGGRIGYASPAAARAPHVKFVTTIHDLFGVGDRVVARITHAVTYAEDIPNFPRIGPVKAAGKSVHWDANVIFRFRDGRVAEEWISRDELGMMQQLGAIPAAVSTGS